MCTRCNSTALSSLKHHQWDEDTHLCSELSHFRQTRRASVICWAAVSRTCFRKWPISPSVLPIWIRQVLLGSGNSPANIVKWQRASKSCHFSCRCKPTTGAKSGREGASLPPRSVCPWQPGVTHTRGRFQISLNVCSWHPSNLAAEHIPLWGLRWSSCGVD